MTKQKEAISIMIGLGIIGLVLLSSTLVFCSTSLSSHPFSPSSSSSHQTSSSQPTTADYFATQSAFAPSLALPTSATQPDPPSQRSDPAMASDAKDGYVLLFGGRSANGQDLADTWTFKNGVWHRLFPATSPLARENAMMTYDALDGYIVLFGGFSNSVGSLGDTWKYVAGVWTEISAGGGPAPRCCAAMTYDPQFANGYVLLFGGFGSSGVLGDTWYFGGGSWNQITPSPSPPARWEVGHSGMVYDTADGYVVMFGGQETSGCCLGDTWEFKFFLCITPPCAPDYWTQVFPSTSPSARWGQGLAYDAKDGYVVLFGGKNASSNLLGDTWKYRGGSWIQIFPNTSPSSRVSSGMTYDTRDGYALLFGGGDSTGAVGDTWAFRGGQWLRPFPRWGAMMAFDATDHYTQLFGGQILNRYGFLATLGDTWKFKGGFWTRLFPTSSPPSRAYGAMVYDAADGYILLFGGESCNGSGSCVTLSDTWIFKGGVWTELFPSASPLPRYGASIAYDAKDDYVILFGGLGTSGSLGDTWKYRAGVWSQLFPSTSPSPRQDAAMTYDGADGYVFLFGGGTASTCCLGDYWSFSGGAWTDITSLACSTPGVCPQSRTDASMAYDGANGYVLLFGGYDNIGFIGDTWKFKGGTWTLLAPSIPPMARGNAAMTYDAADKYVLLFGGYWVPYELSVPLGDTWNFRSGAWSEI